MSASDDISEFVSENSELIGRVLACGSDEARAYALALVANAEESAQVEEVQAQLDRIHRELES